MHVFYFLISWAFSQNQGYHVLKVKQISQICNILNIWSFKKNKHISFGHHHYYMTDRDYYLHFTAKQTEVQKNETTCSKRTSRDLQTGALTFLKPNQQRAYSFPFHNVPSINQKGSKLPFGESNNHGNNLMDGGGKNSRIPNLQDLRTKAIAPKGFNQISSIKTLTQSRERKSWPPWNNDL